MIRLNSLAKIGEILEITQENGNARTKLQEFIGEDEFTIFHPVINGISMFFYRDKPYVFTFYRSNGIYMFEAQIVKAYIKDDIKLCRLKQISDVKRHQRRQAYRIQAIFDVEVDYALDENGEEIEVISAKTMVISEKGLQMVSHAPLKENTRVGVRLYIGESEILELNAEVFKCQKPKMKGQPYDVVLNFIDCSDKAQKRMRQLTMRQQIKRYRGYIQR